MHPTPAIVPRLLLSSLLVVLALTLSGCLTSHLWATPEEEVRWVIHDDNSFRFETERDPAVLPRHHSAWGITWRCLVTPFALVGDLALLPLQGMFADPSEVIESGLEEGWRSIRH